jgi:glycosyltransferase involved in cell wall biosynthesis
MSPEIFFSIVIPSYNRAKFIQKTIETALNQQYKAFEIIVVDDGSTDNTFEIVKGIEHPALRYTRIENSERGFARNVGIDMAKGDYITFLDSDDILFPDYLKNARESLVKNNYPPFFHLAYEIRDEEMNSLRSRRVPKDNIHFLVKGNDLSCLGIFIRQDITKDFRFNTDRNLSGSEDWELWLRLAANFGLSSDNRVSAALIIHNARSVLSYDERKLEMRKILALKYAFQDPQVEKVFGKYRHVMEAYCNTYIALHLVLAGENKRGLHYLIQSFKIHPPSIFERRFFAIIKYILLNGVDLR